MRSDALRAAMLMSMLAMVHHREETSTPRAMRETPPKPRKRVAIDRSKLHAQQREIAEWNDEVDRRKAEKKLATKEPK